MLGETEQLTEVTDINKRNQAENYVIVKSMLIHITTGEKFEQTDYQLRLTMKIICISGLVFVFQIIFPSDFFLKVFQIIFPSDFFLKVIVLSFWNL